MDDKPSDDLRALLALVFQDGYEIQGHQVHIENKEDGQHVNTKITLSRDGAAKTFESPEPDVSFFAFRQQKIFGSGGEKKFRAVKDLNQYWEDVRFLIDEDKTKMQRAIESLQAGEHLAYDPTRLLEECLLRESRPFSKRYLPLKRDYYKILAMHLIISRDALKLQEQLIKRRPEAKPFLDATQGITAVFLRTGNPLSGYREYKRYVDVEFSEYGARVNAQLKIVETTLKDLLKKGSMPVDEAVPRLLDVYKTILEISKPVVDVLYAAIQLRAGAAPPFKAKGMTEMIEAIRADPAYGNVFRCLDPMLRHTEAHASFEVAGGSVLVYDYRSKRRKWLKTYSAQEVGEIVREAQQCFFPAALSCLAIMEMAMVFLVLVSPE